MIRFSVCVEKIFGELPLAERIQQCAACGAEAVEFRGWRDKDLDVIACSKEAAGVHVAAFNALGSRSPNDPAAVDEVITELLLAVETARQIGATGLIINAGRELQDVSREQQLEGLAAVLSAAAPTAARAHITLLLEPLNARIDCPGTLLSKTADARAVVDGADQPNVKMLFDVYHQYVTEGSVLHSIESNIDRIGHFHVADVPGGGEPGTGAVDFKELFKLIDSLAYNGYVGLDFQPSGDSAKAVRDTIGIA